MKCKKLPNLYTYDKLLILAVITQILFWYGIPQLEYGKWYWEGVRKQKPDIHIVPEVPGEHAAKALSFGDEQLYFRVLALELQNAGDTYGRFTSLMEYDYPKLEQWFYLLDTLDSRSNFVPSLASYIYGQTPTKSDVIYVAPYLADHANKDIDTKWWWMAQAVYLANHKLDNKELALQYAYDLAKSNNPDMPIWAKQMPAFILNDIGENQEALIIIQSIINNIDNISDGELNFMHHFIKDRLGYENHPPLK